MEDEPHRDEDTLRRLYWSENKSLREMAEELEVGARTVSRNMEKCGVPRREPEHQRGGVHLRFNDGYLTWKPNVRGESYSVRVHRLVAVAEYGYEAVKSNVVHHKNRHKSDNRPENLELMTQAEHNREHAEEAFGDE
jgi:predicted DNA-binding transcriptional regulator YafY